jgi:hypothetical protein
MFKHKHINSHIDFLNEIKKCLHKFEIQTTKTISFKKESGFFEFGLRSHHLNCLKLMKELPPLYSTKKKRSFDKTIKRIYKIKNIESYEELLENEKKKARKYAEAIKLRKEMGWGKRKIAKEIDIDQSSVARWIYYNVKSRSFRNLRND